MSTCKILYFKNTGGPKYRGAINYIPPEGKNLEIVFNVFFEKNSEDAISEIELVDEKLVSAKTAMTEEFAPLRKTIDDLLNKKKDVSLEELVRYANLREKWFPEGDGKENANFRDKIKVKTLLEGLLLLSRFIEIMVQDQDSICGAYTLNSPKFKREYEFLKTLRTERKKVNSLVDKMLSMNLSPSSIDFILNLTVKELSEFRINEIARTSSVNKDDSPMLHSGLISSSWLKKNYSKGFLSIIDEVSKRHSDGMKQDYVKNEFYSFKEHKDGGFKSDTIVTILSFENQETDGLQNARKKFEEFNKFNSMKFLKSFPINMDEFKDCSVLIDLFSEEYYANSKVIKKREVA